MLVSDVASALTLTLVAASEYAREVRLAKELLPAESDPTTKAFLQPPRNIESRLHIAHWFPASCLQAGACVQIQWCGTTLPMRAALDIATGDHIVGSWECFQILIWRVETTLEGVKAAQSTYNKLVGQHPEGVFLLTVVEQSAPMPTSEVRKALAGFLASGANRTILSAVVHEGAGFRAAAVRSVVTGLAMLTNLPYPHRVFATVAEACEWYRENSSVARRWAPNEFRDAVAELRQRVGKTPTA